VFVADTVLAKHDEAYMPAEVVEALREQGEWYGDEGVAPAP
jgi:cytochrome c-type biogenesis protein CcmE